MPVKPVVEWRYGICRWLGYLLLWPASLLFSVYLFVRDFLRQSPTLRESSTGQSPFIVIVGSIAVGGSGKTPVVEWIARELNKRNHRVCILNHGYKKSKAGIVTAYDGISVQATPEEAGDESAMMAQSLSAENLPIPVVAAEKRNDAIHWMHTNWQPEAILLDDGLQDNSIMPDFTIGVMDQDELEYPQLPLPIGRLRDRIKKLKRCDARVVTKYAGSQIKFPGDGIPLVWIPKRLVKLAEGSHHPLDILKNQRVLAFAGIGHFEPFRRLVLDFGRNADDIRFREYADHHDYSQDDMRWLTRRDDVTVFVTTHKDAVKIAQRELIPFLQNKLYYLDIHIEGGAELIASLETAMSDRHHPNPFQHIDRLRGRESFP